MADSDRAEKYFPKSAYHLRPFAHLRKPRTDRRNLDAQQQITPETLSEMLQKLVLRRENTEEIDFQIQLKTLRSQIDILDEQLLDLIRKRMEIADNIGKLKKQKNISVLQNKRWNEIIERMKILGKEKNLSEELILRIFKAIHQESIDRQEDILSK